MIPKTIHYIWLGKNKKPKSFGEVFNSWVNFAKGYEIKEWNEENIVDFDLPKSFFDLLDKKQYAFASDILRFYILEKYGGVYFDIDQALISSIDDLLIEDMFISKYHERDDYYGFGLIGINKNYEFSKRMINFYSKDTGNDFIIVNKIGSEIINRMLLVGYKIKILDQEYFYPLNKVDFTQNTRSYHLSNTSWIPWWKRVLFKMPFYNKIKKMFKKVLPDRLKNKIFKIKY